MTIKMKRLSRCPTCGGAMRETTEVKSFFYGAGKNPVELTVRTPVLTCEACGLALLDWRYEEIEREAIRRHHLGLLNPHEVRMIRLRLGLSQAELAHLTGYGLRSIKRWETGTLTQNTSADRFLRLLDSDLTLVEKLRHIVASLAK